jgi:predicted ArsR family transcriptional regulator
MSDEVSQMKQRITELEAENRALRAQTQRDAQEALDPKAREILQYLCDNPRNMTLAQVASQFRLAKSVAEYHLEALFAAGYVAMQQSLSEQRPGGNLPGFVITEDGRASVVRHRLIDHRPRP